MRVGLLKNFLHCFTLKQGTVLIALTQLFGSGIMMTFCLLALAHAMDVREMVARDSEDALEREAFEDGNSMHMNTKIMKIAHQNATDKVSMIYYGLVLVIIHLVSSIFLLYGILMNNRHFMAPWLVINPIEFGASIIYVFLFYETLKLGMIERISETLTVLVNFYSCFVVYSAYRSLGAKKGLTHEIHGTKSNHTHHPGECSKSRLRCATEPHEV